MPSIWSVTAMTIPEGYKGVLRPLQRADELPDFGGTDGCDDHTVRTNDSRSPIGRLCSRLNSY